MYEIIFMLTALTVNGPISAGSEIALGPFNNQADCTAYGEQVQPVANHTMKMIVQMAQMSSGDFSNIQPFGMNTNDGPISVTFKCQPVSSE